MDLTAITKNIGNTIARLKQNNQLIEDLNKQCANPTFLEILEDAKKTNGVLATMLILWYEQKYSNNVQSSIYDELMDNLELEEQKKQKKKSKPRYVLESGCGNTSGWMYSGGCGSSSWKNDSGCGSSSSSSGGC